MIASPDHSRRRHPSWHARCDEQQTLGIRMRPDLVCVPTRHRHEGAVIVKDPIAMKYHRLRPDEFFVLQSLRPATSLRQLCEAYQTQYPDRRVSPAVMNDLLLRLHQLGLTISAAAGQGDRLLQNEHRERGQRWLQFCSNLLFVRFPGVDPEPLLRRIHSLVRPVFSPIGGALLAGLIMISLMVLAGNWQRFLSEIPSLQDWLRVRNVVLLGLVIGALKVCHELGHAITCKHFGGECHQIGPMLLVFTPALYCDTSDSWMLPNRFARAAVGSAGVLAEVLLASTATLLWAATGPSMPHFLALNVMLVGGVSTVLFNANPLLRYDGYFVLSDLCDVPNLGQRARTLLGQRMASWCLGIRSVDRDPTTENARFWLTLYGLAATVYRWLLTAMILWFVIVLLRPQRLESVAVSLCLMTASMGLIGALRTPIKYLSHPGRRRQIRRFHTLRLLAFAGILLGLSWIPVPIGESACGRLVPRDETPIFLATAGHLDHVLVHAGDSVQPGQVLAELSHPDVEWDLIHIQSRVDAQQAFVRSLRDSQFEMPEAANDLPAAETMLGELQRQLQRRKLRSEALTVRAPIQGRLLVGPRREPPSVSESSISLAGWSGLATDAANRGCFVEAGTELFSIVRDDHWDAELVLSADQIQRIAKGNSVRLILESTPQDVWHGTVCDISIKQWDSQSDGHRHDARVARDRTAPVASSYAVRVALAKCPAAATGIPIAGAAVTARISTQPISVAGYVWRHATRLFRIR